MLSLALLHHLHEHVLRNVHLRMGATLLLPFLLFLKQLHFSGDVTTVQVAGNILGGEQK